MDKEQLLAIVAQFTIDGRVSEIKPLGNGLINDTFKVTTVESKTPDYVLQHVNDAIFQNVDMLMDNIVAVTSHIRNKLESRGEKDIDRKVLSFIPAINGKYYYKDADARYWRIMRFIPDAVTKSEVTPESSYEVGLAFGDFQASLADIGTELGETIPNFHNMEFRMKQLREAVRDDKAGRLNEVQELVDSIEKDSFEMCQAERMYRHGVLPKRICHCDTKVDNLMFDRDGNVLCVIDLDTVMPNFVFSDIGDFLRSAANTGKEDDPDLDNVSFNMDIFRAFARGYIKSARSFLLPVELEHIPFAARLFPFMQTVRFLADYLNGDTYYKTQYAEHNLVRSRAQWKLYQSATQAESEMRDFVKECML